MKLLHLSDTHGCHHRLYDLPDADVLVHSGDFTLNGSEAEAIDFMNWFCDIPYRHKIFICGNHDNCLYGANIVGLDSNVHYLCNSGIEIEGLKFYGVPMFMGDCLTDLQSNNYARIPADTDILITHSPAFGILDLDNGINYGSEELLKAVSKINPQIHLFGHIHSQHGIVSIGHTVFSNGAISGVDSSVLNVPNVLDRMDDNNIWRL